MTMTIEVKAKSGKITELYQTLLAFLPTMRKEKGCRNCRVCLDGKNEDVICLYSEWDEPGSLEGYIQSGAGSALIGAIDLLAGSARIQAGSDAKWNGIEALKRMRNEI